MLALLLVAVSVGLDNFGAATGLGVGGVDRTLRLRVALIFGVFEGVMPVAGLLLGHSLASHLGKAADPVAGTMLGVAGTYAVVSKWVGGDNERRDPGRRTQHLLVLGAVLSIDNLVIGFALGTHHVNIVVAATTIAVVSVALSLLGLEIGGRLGERLGQRAELVGGLVLIAVGALVGTGLL